MFNLKTIDKPNKGAGYILVDGSFLMLDLNKKRIEQVPESKMFHPHLDNYLKRKYNEDADLDRIIYNKYNGITINDGNNFGYEIYIDLPKTVTSKQWQSLLDYLYYLMNNNKKFVQLQARAKCIKIYNFISKDNPDGWLPEDIIKDLKRNLCLNKS